MGTTGSGSPDVSHDYRKIVGQLLDAIDAGDQDKVKSLALVLRSL